MIRASAWLAPIYLALIGSASAQSAPPPPSTSAWETRHIAVFAALNKAYAQTATIKIAAGQSAAFETITMAVTACDMTGPGVPAGAAARLSVTDTRGGAVLFSGWMLSAAPSASMLEDAVYDVRLIGCE